MRQQKRRRQSGQSIVELTLTLFAFFTVAFMYVQVALGFGVANYFQYATFMSARALLSGAEDLAAQKKAAGDVLQVMVRGTRGDRFKSIAQGSGDVSDEIPGAFIGPVTKRVTLGKEGARADAWEQGVTYKFKEKLYMMPMISAAKKSSSGGKVELTSESWLGRDPTEDECTQQMTTRASKTGQNGIFIYDNGC